MTGTEVAALQALAKILEVLGQGPVLVAMCVIALVAVIGPWIAMVLLSRASDKRSAEAEEAAAERAAAHDLKAAENLAALNKIAEAGWKAYADNVELVKETQAVAKQAVALSEQLAEIIHLNTQTQTTLAELIKNNMYCPLNRRAVGKD